MSRQYTAALRNSAAQQRGPGGVPLVFVVKNLGRFSFGPPGIFRTIAQKTAMMGF
jgi:hypothetical protein